jgi:Tfp pilus assembly PilM family ATPase
MIFNVLRRDIEIIVDELERSYRYVLSCFPQRRPGPLLLVGGGSGMRNLDRYIAERVGLEVRIPTLEAHETGNLRFDQVASALREPISSFACAVGLSLAGEGSNG